MRIACVGGGIAGLFTAIRLREARPDWDVSVLERKNPSSPAGFGVVFSNPAVEAIRALDERLGQCIDEEGTRWTAIEVRTAAGSIRCEGQGFRAVSRQRLTETLEARAARAGVRLCFDTPVSVDALPDADVVVATDGARSTIRTRHEVELGVRFREGRTRFVWLATPKRFDALTFAFRKSVYGTFAIHAYPHERSLSTFIVEADSETVRRAGLADPDPAVRERALRFLSEVFAPDLAGEPLLGNPTAWEQFRVVRAERWSSGNIVLAGDAAHTAHFSVGSGTRAALDDAVALSHALVTSADVPDALRAFERARRPEMDRLQQSAGDSLTWWESFERVESLPLDAFAAHFLTRNHRVRIDSLRRRDGAFVERVANAFVARFGGSGAAHEAPLRIGALRLSRRVVALGYEDATVAVPALRLLTTQQALEGPVKGGREDDSKIGVILEHDLPERIPEHVQWVEIDALRGDVAQARELAPRGALVGRVRATIGGAAPEEYLAEAAMRQFDALHVLSSGSTRADFALCDYARHVLGLAVLVDVPDATTMETLLLGDRADLCLVTEVVVSDDAPASDPSLP